MSKQYKVKRTVLLILFFVSIAVTFVFGLWILIGLISINAGRDASPVPVLTWIILIGVFIGSLAVEAILVGLLKDDTE